MRQAGPWISFLLAIVAFSASLGNGLVWDDPIIIKDQLAHFKTVGDIFVPPQGIPQFSRGSIDPS